MAKIIVFDTTLRDGEQSPGCTMSTAEKLRMAHRLDELGVDVIEAGFPVASDDDFNGVRSIVREVRRPIIAALARAHPVDVDRAAKAVEEAAHPRVHVFLATSDIHLEHKLEITRDECLSRVVEAVERARRLADDVEFSAEDATRTDVGFLCQVVKEAVEAGATTINIPDTVGYTLPQEYVALMTTLFREVEGLDKVVVSVHCHDDLGMAVANSLAAIEAGGATGRVHGQRNRRARRKRLARRDSDGAQGARRPDRALHRRQHARPLQGQPTPVTPDRDEPSGQ